MQQPKNYFIPTQWLVTFSLLTLIACGGTSKVLISDAEIESAKASGTLESLYQKSTRLVSENTGSSKKEASMLQSKIAAMLVEQSSKQVDQLLEKHTSDINSVTRVDFKNTFKNISGMQQWSAPDYSQNSERLNSALAKTNSLITQYTDKSQASGVSLVEKIKLLSRAAKLAGEGETEAVSYQTEYKNAIAQFIYQGNDALTKGLFNTVITSAQNGLEIDPGNVQFESMLSQGQAGLFEKDFRFALENGKPESAFLSLMEVADKPIFLQLKKSMHKSILFLANFFASSAKYAYDKGDLSEAYKHFVRGRKVQQTLGITQLGFAQEKKFLDLIHARAMNTNSTDGKRQSLLRMINEFDANYPGLQSEYLKLTENIKQRALTKLAVTDFKEVAVADPVVASVGRRISSKLEKNLFERLGNEILIVANTALTSSSEFSGLSLLIDGEVLQAAIESASNQGKRALNVQTGINRIETEEYAKWAKRKRGDAPVQYHETVIMEEVVLTIEHIRKQAIAEISFRIIEPGSNKLLLTDSFMKEAEFSGESINEYQKGDFHQQYVPADLPSDIKIIDALSADLAQQLSDKLAAYLQNPEQIFYQKYQEAKAQADIKSAIELLANALTIAENKSLNTDSWYSELKEIALLN